MSEADYAHEHLGITESTTPDWNFAEGVPGQGNRPDWFDGNKYKSVADQAKAYKDVERRMHEVTSELSLLKSSAPEEYDWRELKEVFAENVHMKNFADVARQHNIPQESFEAMLDSLVNYDMSRLPNPQKELEALGPDAAQKLEVLEQWALNTLPEEFHSTFGRLAQTAETIKMFDTLRNATANQGVNPPAGSSTAPIEPTLTRADIYQEMKANEKQYLSDPRYRAEISRKFEKALQNE